MAEAILEILAGAERIFCPRLGSDGVMSLGGVFLLHEVRQSAGQVCAR